MKFALAVINRIREEKAIVSVLFAIGVVGVYVVVQSSFSSIPLVPTQQTVALYTNKSINRERHNNSKAAHTNTKKDVSSNSANLQMPTTHTVHLQENISSQTDSTNQLTNQGISPTSTPMHIQTSSTSTPTNSPPLISPTPSGIPSVSPTPSTTPCVAVAQGLPCVNLSNPITIKLN